MIWVVLEQSTLGVVNNYIALRSGSFSARYTRTFLAHGMIFVFEYIDNFNFFTMASAFGLRLTRRPGLSSRWVCDTCRSFHVSAATQSGHSRWSTIKHDKAKNDKAKSKERGILTQELINASQREFYSFLITKFSF